MGRARPGIMMRLAVLACLVPMSARAGEDAGSHDVTAENGARIAACAIAAWSTDADPGGLNVRAAPRGDAAIIGNLPAAREVGGERFATEMSITGSKDGWLRISEGFVLDYIFDEPTKFAFRGEGWVSGRHLGLRLNHRHLYGAPSSDAPAVAKLAGSTGDYPYGPDSFLVARIYACSGDWVEVEAALTVDGETTGPALRGWTTGTCSNQVTTCP